MKMHAELGRHRGLKEPRLIFRISPSHHLKKRVDTSFIIQISASPEHKVAMTHSDLDHSDTWSSLMLFYL